MDKKDSLHDLFGAIGVIVLLVVEILIVMLALFGLQGAEEETNIFVFIISANIGLFGAILIFCLKLGQYIVQTSKSYKAYGWVGSVLHDPETSFIPVHKKSFSWIKNPFIFGIVWIIPTSILGLVQVYTQTFFTAIEAVPQQITETAKGILSIIPSDMEVYIPLALCGLLITLFTWMKNTGRLDEGFYYLLIYLGIPVLYTGTWTVLHFFHHGSSQVAIQYVVLFGIICSYMLVIFRSFIPIWIFKIMNNLYQYLNGVIQSNEGVLIMTVVLNILVVAGFVFYITTRSRVKVKA